jgi:alkanesulfonate monooxygenase SsuD/methylene tetrahydromethanopterin reductase-like flavin-dependent oxidoreductase (luciferase family)
MPLRLGLLAPHFGAQASRELLIGGARLAETYGFDSLWVRDHLVFEPHGMEGSNDLFLEALATLAHIAGTTERIGLGTATLIPTRHPIYLAQSLASLSWLANRPIDLGFGAGRFQHEFDALGLEGVDRPTLATEQLSLARRLWRGEEVTYQSPNYAFEHVHLRPLPPQPIRIWWGGGAPASTRLAVAHCDGWLPSRLDFRTFEKRALAIRDLCAQAGRPVIALGNVPIASVGSSRHDALQRVNLPGLLAHANGLRFVVRPTSGQFERAEDLAGGLLAGTPADIVADLEHMATLGCELVILDLRFRFDDWLDQIRLLGEEVLPHVRNVAAGV